MIRSRLPLIRVILVPYLVLLLLFGIVAGAGSAWLYLKARQAQSQLLIHGLLGSVTPLVERLARNGTSTLVEDRGSWLHREVENIFLRMPDLENVSVRTGDKGFRKYHGRDHNLVTEQIGPATTDRQRDLGSATAARRLYSESAPLLRIEFMVNGRDNRPVRLEFGFNRATLRNSVSRALAILLQAITFFLVVSLLCLSIAFGVTLWAAGRVRWLEAHVQELYRHASAAELMAGLVHDLRNPLASFRANLASLRITPEEREEILAEMDQDLVRLDTKLGSMLDLTRKRDEKLRPVDCRNLLESVARLAEPRLADRGLQLDIRCQTREPIILMADAMRDALLNLVINSAESGQQEGAIILEARHEDGRVTFEVSDQGSGLPEGTDVFAPFVTTKTTGHGLGLAISRRTVEAHGGTIRARNRTGGGSTFTITIPQPPSGEIP